MKKILITDTLFIFREHEEALVQAGFVFERLPKPQATEEELIKNIKGQSGYILGGIEKITENIINAADKLEVIVFTGADYRQFIPAHEVATKKGIAIANCPGANSYAVAEYAMTLILAMTRDIFNLGRTGIKMFKTTTSLPSLSVGIVGMGHVGERVARMLRSFGVKELYYFSRTRKENLEQELSMKYLSLSELLTQCNVVTLHASKEAGDKYLGKNELARIQKGSLLINTSFETAIDLDALFDELKSGRLRAAHDGAVDAKFKDLPLDIWFNSNSHTAYNTHEANKVASDMAIESMINLLNGREDKYVVNPDYKKHRK
jgi:phosphoglycerate dehydrogenase-like enzyme